MTRAGSDRESPAQHVLSSALGPGLAADVAHAARGPFSAALPALDMLRSGLLGELADSQRDALLTVERAVRRAFADSGDLAMLLALALSRSQLRRTPAPVPDLLAAALKQAGLDESVAVRTTTGTDVPPVLVDRELTAALLAVLVRRCAGSPCSVAAGPHPGASQADPDVPLGLLVGVDMDPAAPGHVRVCASRVGGDLGAADGPSRTLMSEPGSSAEGGRESRPEVAPLLLVWALIEAQGGRARAEPGATTVWLPVASTAAPPAAPSPAAPLPAAPPG